MSPFLLCRRHAFLHLPLQSRALSTLNLTARVDVPTLGEIDIPTGLHINGQWIAGRGEAFSTVNPATGEKLVEVSHASAEDVDDAVKAARHAFKTTWGMNVAATERARLINRLADLLERDAHRIAAVESLNGGKGIRIAREADVADSVACLRYYAGMADKIHGQTTDAFGGDKLALTLHQPIGVCGQIIPWNYPLQMWAWKVAPALAAGCTIVMKPSELTPLTALMMNALASEAELPAGVLNTVPGLGKSTGDAIARHMDIDKVAFTGSVPTGKRISIAAAESNLKKVTLELGGKSPMLVFASADTDEAAQWTANGIWYNSGQDCCASSRIYVQANVFDRYVNQLRKRALTVAIGAPSDERTSFGPLISEGQRDKVLGYITSAKEEGARLVSGGRAWPRSNGFYVEPTILANSANKDLRAAREEIFGPVVVVTPFRDEEHALELANDSPYGLAAAVFTSDTRQAIRVARGLDAGSVWINQYGAVHNNVPFGGFKQSGIGRELGTYGLESYLQVKAVHLNLGVEAPWPI
ncbi:hypothetical protein CspHIS471_0403350 [Cutaneotrichosporon sp. HIS471]|nr:hypothetical protein CspHIS471_0403350 [Cutaneotrichosporon sp. HIS471]